MKNNKPESLGQAIIDKDIDAMERLASKQDYTLLGKDIEIIKGQTDFYRTDRMYNDYYMNWHFSFNISPEQISKEKEIVSKIVGKSEESKILLGAYYKQVARKHTEDFSQLLEITDHPANKDQALLDKVKKVIDMFGLRRENKNIIGPTL